ncbi:MAG TPA: hypothetical protein VHM88_04375 [Candidatus Acidoferrales bacterium]|jgi:hypothetical protein|nr:hypothetical protein [Candidatus Acidoferrales bacterium]
MAKSCSFLLVLLFAIHPPSDNQKDKHSEHFGSLVITATAILAGEEGKTDRHYVFVFVSIKNTGKKPACASFSTKLKTTYGLEYATLSPFFDFAELTRLHRRAHLPNEPKVYEMLPGEQSNGAYVFAVKNGVEPLEMSMKLSGGRGIRCGSARDRSFGDVLLTEEVKLDVHDLPAPKN